MKKLYILLFNPSYDVPTVARAFLTREEAEIAVREQKTHPDEEWTVHEVDAPKILRQLC